MRRALALCGALALLLPGSALAHAVVEDTTPPRGAALERAPKRVEIRFSEAVETRFGALRVYAADGRRVDRGDLQRPSASRVAVPLRADPPDGPYTATFRVISADSHPVAGGFVFTVGRSGGRAATSVDELIDTGGSGTATSIVFGAARAVAYAATALLMGGAIFVLAVWLPALRAQSPGESVAAAFGQRGRSVTLLAAVAGAVGTAVGIVCQGATAAGISLWSALDLSVIADVLATRFGTMWGIRLAAFVVLALLVAAGRVRPRAVLALAAGALAALVITPGLAGHPGAQDSALLVPMDSLHVLAMSTWVGGIALLLTALPGATRELEPGERSGLLSAVLDRFSTLALAAVAVLVATGIVQSVVQLESLSDLTDTAFGRAVAIKSVLLLVLVGIGAFNRRRALPGVRRAAADGVAPGGAGVSIRRALRAELVLMAAVLVVAAALVSYPPGAGAADGPFAADRDLGPARLELTVDPARAGRNEIHLYLFDRRTGAQYDRFDELTIEARQRERDIGPIDLKPRETGPGHLTVRRADLAPSGGWRLEVAMRKGEFDLYEASVEVPVK